MINSTYHFVTEFFVAHKEFKNMLDVGSLDVSGNIREYIQKDIAYTGTDMREGNNIDVVVNAHELLTKFQPESFDVVCCFDTFEHDDKFWESWSQIKQVVKRGGYILLGMPGRYTPLHEHPGDFWRFMPGSLDLFFPENEFEDIYTKIVRCDDYNQELENELYRWGRKK